MIQAGAGDRLAPPPLLRPGVTKVALIGTAPTVDFAPWHDESWAIWSHASSAEKWPRVDVAFEMHPECVWRESAHKQGYLKWLQRCRYPLVMLEQYPDIPSSVRFPQERLFAECHAMIGRERYGSHGDYMIHLALTMGAKEIGFFGMHYVDPVKDGDRMDQLIAIQFWIGVAAGRGVRLHIPKGNPIVSIPKENYGYESHSTQEKYQARLKREQAVARKPSPWEPVRPDRLVPSDGTGLRSLPPTLGLGHKPAPERWEQAVGA